MGCESRKCSANGYISACGKKIDLLSNFLVPSRETTILMNFLNLTSYDIKIGSVDSYNEHSRENGP